MYGDDKIEIETVLEDERKLMDEKIDEYLESTEKITTPEIRGELKP